MLCDTGDRGAASGRTELFSRVKDSKNPLFCDDPEVMSIKRFNRFRS
jgi:hypothetical protein